MALQHAVPGEVIDVHPLGAQLRESATHAILRTDSLELMRVILRVGDEWPRRGAPGEMTLLLLEGAAVVEGGFGERRLAPGQLILLPPGAEHVLRALEDSSLLVTAHRPPESRGDDVADH
jgi:quercetin dioxygenase-like cupin family protein